MSRGFTRLETVYNEMELDVFRSGADLNKDLQNEMKA